VHLFTKIGVDPNRMVAIGYGEHRHVADNASAAGRARNQRVVLVIPAHENIRRILGAENKVEIKTGRT
jgi:chemotaxis protein MotB